MLSRIFVNEEERRLRALWRLLLHLVITLLAAVIAGIALAVVSGEDPRAEWTSPSTSLLYSVAEIATVAGPVLACGWLLDRRRLRDFGFRFDRVWRRDFGFGLVLGAGLQGSIFLVELACGWVDVTGYAVEQEGGGPFAVQMFCMLLLFVSVAFSEELLSRGYHLKNLAEGLAGLPGLGPRGAVVAAVLISSTVFGVLHATNEHATWWSVANLVLAGVGLAAGMLLTGELAIPIGYHLAWNFVEGNVLGFPVSGEDVGPTVIAIEQRGPEWLTGGAFGPEAGALGTVAELLGLALIVLWVRRHRGAAALQVSLAEPELRGAPAQTALSYTGDSRVRDGDGGSMKLIEVAAGALNQVPLDWDGNKDRILQAIESARSRGVTLLCLPEMCIPGYGCEDAFHAPATARTALAVLGEILPATRGMIVSLGLPIVHRNAVFNAACLAVDGRVRGFVGKKFLAGEGIHYEPRWFKAWPEGVRAEIEFDGREVPLGDLFFDCGGVRIGFEICEDAWVANRPGGSLFAKGVDVILNPSASHFAFDKHEVRRRFVLEGSRAFGVSYVYCDLLGNEAGRAIYDGGTLVASGGKLLAVGKRLSFADVSLACAQIDVDATRMVQTRLASYEPDVQGGGSGAVEAPFDFPDVEPRQDRAETDAWENGSHVKEEEFTRAVALGLFDYMRKSRSNGFVVSASGGADSSAVACLVALMVRLAEGELGRDGFAAKLPPGAAGATVRDLLTCVYQSARSSSDTTLGAARQLAEALGATFHHFDVTEQVDDYSKMVADAIGRPLTWEADDIALQNIQSRVRAPGVWMLANIKNALLLATSNRSEAAVGYATMDGDTCGGLSPIAGIDKAFLRRWLRWLESTGPDGIGPIPALAAVNALAPTAELRPAEEGQTDEGDLMPYEVLDDIERAAIRDKRNPLEVYRTMRGRFPQYAREQLHEWVERFFRLWCRNQWKRERYAPSFHLDDENLDPKTWCRFPILSGGFERELAELREYCRESGPES